MGIKRVVYAGYAWQLVTDLVLTVYSIRWVVCVSSSVFSEGSSFREGLK